MATVIDLLRQLGHGEGPDGANAVCGPIAIPAAPVAALGVAMPRALVTGWTELTGRTTTAEHALAAAASRAGEAVCFTGSGSTAHDDLLLLTAAELSSDPGAAALWLVSDHASSVRAGELLGHLLSLGHISWRTATERPGREGPTQLVIATYDDLHGRVLRFADRAWRWIWPSLSIVALPDLQHATGTLGNHLLWLIRRARRLAQRDLRFFTAASAGPGVGELAYRILGEKCRLLESRASRPDPTLVVLWQCSDRSRALGILGSQLAARGLAVTVLGRDDRETDALREGNSLPAGLVVGLGPSAARVALVAGVPCSPEARDAILYRGYRLVVMLAGDEPHERLFASEIGCLPRAVPLLPLTARNPYVGACHLQSAAAELPITPVEVERWQAGELVERLAERRLLRPVTGVIYPGDASSEISPDLLAAQLGIAPVSVHDPHGAEIARLPPSVADWRGLPGSTWETNLSVVNRSEQPPTIDLAVDERPGLVLPELTVRVALRESLETRQVPSGARTLTVSSAKIHVHQRVDGLREYVPGGAPVSLRLGQPIARSWTARALFVPLTSPPTDPASAGWSLLTALPLVLRTQPGDLLASYDRSESLLWLIETEQGGSGIAETLLSIFERLLEAAYTLAHACTASPRYATVAGSEVSWLEALRRLDMAEPVVSGGADAAESAPSAVPAAHPLPPPGMPARRSRVYAVPLRDVSVQLSAEVPVVAAEVGRIAKDRNQIELASGADRTAANRAFQADVSLEESPGEKASSSSRMEPAQGVTDGERLERQDPEAPGRPAPAEERPRETIETAPVDDVRWALEPRMYDAAIEDVTWRPEAEEAEVDDVEWDAAVPQQTQNVPSQAPLPEVPPLGQESAVSLNAPRRSSRYPAQQTQRNQRRPRPAVPPSQSQEPPCAVPAAPRRESPSAPPPNANERLPAPAQRVPDEPAVDVGAMIARMRRLREERERDRINPRPPTESRGPDDDPPVLRFQPGQRVTCVPYGEGVVRDAWIVNGREQLSIEFPGAGAIDVDPAVNAVRGVSGPVAEAEPGDEL